MVQICLPICQPSFSFILLELQAVLLEVHMQWVVLILWLVPPNRWAWDQPKRLSEDSSTSEGQEQRMSRKQCVLYGDWHHSQQNATMDTWATTCRPSHGLHTTISTFVCERQCIYTGKVKLENYWVHSVIRFLIPRMHAQIVTPFLVAYLGEACGPTRLKTLMAFYSCAECEMVVALYSMIFASNQECRSSCAQIVSSSREIVQQKHLDSYLMSIFQQKKRLNQQLCIRCVFQTDSKFPFSGMSTVNNGCMNWCVGTNQERRRGKR